MKAVSRLIFVRSCCTLHACRSGGNPQIATQIANKNIVKVVCFESSMTVRFGGGSVNEWAMRRGCSVCCKISERRKAAS